jgi:aspartyl/glutamyl-tRNA(Asn/Gln) amidotransferase C subunit
MIDKDEIQKLSQLSRIGVEKNEFEALRENLNKILDFVAKLKELQLPDSLESGKIEAAPPGTAKAENILREDASPHKAGEYSEVLLKQTPALEDSFVKVKRVLNDQD